MFNLCREDIHRKYSTSYENVIQKKARRLNKHFNNHDFKDSRVFALGSGVIKPHRGRPG